MLLDKLDLVKELKEQFGFDNLQVIRLLNGEHYKDILEIEF